MTTPNSAPEKILLVDDDTNLIAGIQRTLRKNFFIETAASGNDAIRLLAEQGPFAIVVADMQMPEMSGLEFLKIAQTMAPHTVRMMLTGNADLQTAIDAVNDGHVFRYLDKPCPPSELLPALEAGLKLYRQVTQDIATRIRAEEQIREQAALLDQTHDAITVRDLNGRFDFWNKGAELMFGWTREEAADPRTCGLIPTCEPALEGVQRDGVWSGEFQTNSKDSRTITVQMRSTLLRDSDGNPKSVLAICTDITERKKIEVQLLRSQRMESIGTLASGIAHDLNNILCPILMSAPILHGMVSEEGQALTSAIETAARRGTDIVKQVLAFARGIEGERVLIQPRHSIREIVNIANETFPKSIKTRNLAPKDLWPLMGDSTQLHQILLNLCINARDAMPDGGALDITAENLTLDECDLANFPEARPGNYVVIGITDTGTGIPPGVQEKIFDPFFTTKEIGKGTGLGLSTVIGIVKSHAGFLKVYSEVGKGATFRVYLPASPDVSHASQLEELPVLQGGNGEWILVADDEPAIRKVTETMLKRNGYNVLTATDGVDALAIYAQHMDKINLVLTDVMMPILDGTKLALALKKMNSNVAIIVATGQADETRKTELKRLGAKAILSKPYRTDKLLSTLQEAIHG
jgi:two-component system cell cycle sensor histidine kinase/response regulator CckA